MPPIGVTFGSRNGDTTEIVALAKRSEELGYSSFWLGESWGRDCLTILGYAAAKTDRIDLATGIVNVFSRSPAIIAQSAATLDELSGGRFTLGLGTSGPLLVEEWHGVPYQRPLQRTREYVDIVRLVLSGERVNYEGKIFQLRRFRLPFQPLRRHIPIYIAAFGPKNLELTGEVADGWLPIYLHPERFDAMREHLVAGAAKAGRPDSEVAITPWILTAVVDNDHERDAALGEVRATLAFYGAGMGAYYTQLFTGYGFQEEMAKIVEAWRSGDRKAAGEQVSDRMVEALAVVGPAGYCQERYDFYRSRGVSQPVVSLAPGLSSDLIDRTLSALAPR